MVKPNTPAMPVATIIFVFINTAAFGPNPTAIDRHRSANAFEFPDRRSLDPRIGGLDRAYHLAPATA